jgi:hypothetical protein
VSRLWEPPFSFRIAGDAQAARKTDEGTKIPKSGRDLNPC